MAPCVWLNKLRLDKVLMTSKSKLFKLKGIQNKWLQIGQTTKEETLKTFLTNKLQLKNQSNPKWLYNKNKSRSLWLKIGNTMNQNKRTNLTLKNQDRVFMRKKTVWLENIPQNKSISNNIWRKGEDP